MKKQWITSAYASVPVAILTAVLGLVLLIWPSFSGSLICYGISAVVMIYGIYRIIDYFYHAPQDTMRKNGFATGIVLVAVALLMLINPDLILSLLPMLLGLLLVMGAAREIQIAVDLHRMGTKRWVSPLVAGVLQAILGVLILWDPFTTAIVMMRFIGAAVLIESISQVVFAVVLKHSGKKSAVMGPADQDETDNAE